MLTMIHITRKRYFKTTHVVLGRKVQVKSLWTCIAQCGADFFQFFFADTPPQCQFCLFVVFCCALVSLRPIALREKGGCLVIDD